MWSSIGDNSIPMGPIDSIVNLSTIIVFLTEHSCSKLGAVHLCTVLFRIADYLRADVFERTMVGRSKAVFRMPRTRPRPDRPLAWSRRPFLIG